MARGLEAAGEGEAGATKELETPPASYLAQSIGLRIDMVMMRPHGRRITESNGSFTSCDGLSFVYGEKAPGPGNTSQIVFSPIGELDPGARDQVNHRARHEHLAGLGK